MIRFNNKYPDHTSQNQGANDTLIDLKLVYKQKKVATSKKIKQLHLQATLRVKNLTTMYYSQFLDLAVLSVKPSPLKAVKGSVGVSSLALGGREFLMNLRVPMT